MVFQDVWMSCWEDQLLSITFHPHVLTLGVQPGSVLRALFCALPQQWPVTKDRLLMRFARTIGENPMIVNYFITLQPAAACSVTCSSILVCSATRYSFSTLLHLIGTDRVPPNNGIMTGTGWCCALVPSASWPGARSLE